MEIPNLGLQCSELNCKQLDFLPFKCKCGLIFCSEHFIEHSLDCAAVQCNNEPNLENVPADHVCSHPECSNRSYVPLICEKCKLHYCVVHRHINGCITKEEEEEEINAQLEKFAAPVRQFEEAKKKVNDQLDANIEGAKKKAKTRQLANKVQLMRIKNKATGLKSIPSDDRVYFNVQHAIVKNPTETAVYVSKHWTLGRIIDAVAEECKVTNKNNQSNSRKLRLFHKSSREILTSDLSVKLEELLLNESVVDGDELLLEYVEA